MCWRYQPTLEWRPREESPAVTHARVLAGECGGAPGWWCGALEGLILHLQGRYPEAERAFLETLREMEPGDYRLELEVSLMGRNPLVREIVVQVADPGGVPAAA
jgi:hypothetical protein